MTTLLLRKAKSHITHLSSSHASNSGCDQSTAVESELNERSHQQHQTHPDRAAGSRVAEFRRRLARKASTFSLRSKNHRSDTRGCHPPLPQQSKLQIADEGQTNKSSSITDDKPPKLEKLVFTTTTDDALYPSSSSASVASALPTVPVQPATVPALRSEVRGNPSLGEQHQNPQGLQAKVQVRTDIKTTLCTMASASAAPPVSYERMKDIATEACNSALTDIISYSHNSTEGWNTSIINTILAALVQETSTSSTQPQFKYVVNSTIIQHAAGVAGEDGKISGRRGMHSASGAYWNNEKDGMWSFKYEAAEAKGLDVVVGIIWVWVG